MNSTDIPRRGDLWLARLGAVKPGEPGRTRPVLIISPDELLTSSQRELITVVPVSASTPAARLNPQLAPGRGLDVESVAVVRAVRSLARPRLLHRIGEVTALEQRAIDRALLLALGLVA